MHTLPNQIKSNLLFDRIPGTVDKSPPPSSIRTQFGHSFLLELEIVEVTLDPSIQQKFQFSHVDVEEVSSTTYQR